MSQRKKKHVKLVRGRSFSSKRQHHVIEAMPRLLGMSRGGHKIGTPQTGSVCTLTRTSNRDYTRQPRPTSDVAQNGQTTHSLLSRFVHDARRLAHGVVPRKGVATEKKKKKKRSNFPEWEGLVKHNKKRGKFGYNLRSREHIFPLNIMHDFYVLRGTIVNRTYGTHKNLSV